MSDLTAFLSVRLAEDEAKATEIADARRLSDVSSNPPSAPPRVFREVAAKWAILALHEIHSEPTRWGISHSDPAMRGQPTGATTYWCDTCDHDRDYGHIGGPLEGCETLRILAAVYSDHPDYDPAWQVVIDADAPEIAR